jgi:glycosyltransferase involved in cell wall biosynthesis
MRILLASDHYPPFIGGAHRQTQLLGRELRMRGHQVAVATGWHPGLPAQEDDAGVPVHRFRQVRTWHEGQTAQPRQRHQPPFPDPVEVVGLRRLIDEFRPDVVHSYGWISYSVAAALPGREIPLLLSARDYAYGCATRSLLYRGIEPCSGPALRKCLSCAPSLYGYGKGWAAVLGVAGGRELLRRKVDGIHSISTYVQEIVRRDFLGEDEQVPSEQGASEQGASKQGASKQAASKQAPSEQGASEQAASKLGARRPIEAIIPSFREDDDGDDIVYGDDEQIQQLLEQLPGEPFILFVGALRRVKGVQQLLDAYEQMEAPPPLVLIGTYESDSPRRLPPGVHVVPNLPHRAVMAAWDRALFGVIPSLWPEPLGSVVYEGMSRGKAVIGTTPGGHTDMIVDGVTGLLVPQGNVGALYEAMQALLDDPELRGRFGRAGQARSRLFTAEVNVPRFEQLYRQLIDARHSTPDPIDVDARQEVQCVELQSGALRK